MDASTLHRLNIDAEMDRMCLTQHVAEGGSRMEILIWTRALNVEEDVYMEWCLEFYSSLVVDKRFKIHEVASAKIIHFRLGGVEHHCTIPDFGFLTGFLTRAEVERNRIGHYLAERELNAKEFLSRADESWYAMLGIPNHNSQWNKIAEVRVLLLRVIHKMMTYSFLHRSSQNDKVYGDGLWLLHLFHRRDPTVYANVPWVLACFMEKKAVGRQGDNQMCCGHFITRIGKNLNLYTPANMRLCSPEIKWKHITMHDLEASKLLDPTGQRLIGVGPVTNEQGQPRGSRSRDEEMFRIGAQLDRLCGFVGYHYERYQPNWGDTAHARAERTGFPLSIYAPPSLYAPVQDVGGSSGNGPHDDDDEAEDEEDVPDDDEE